MVKRKTDTPTPATLATTATQGGNEWGLPDWRDPAAYGDVTSWKTYRWRWEFYRRRADLRQYFDQFASEAYEMTKHSILPTYSPDEAGFGVPVDFKGSAALGYASIPNPRIGNQLPEIIGFAMNEGVGKILEPSLRPLGDYLRLALAEETREGLARGLFESGLDLSKLPIIQASTSTDDTDSNIEKLQNGYSRGHFESMRARFLAHVSKCYAVELEENKVAVTFDLNRPIGPQIDDAKRRLRYDQEELHKKTLQNRRHPKKWLGYLRTLDAREAQPEASWREFTAALFAHGLVERHKNPAGGYCAPPPQAGRDKWEAANALRFNF